MRKVAIVMGSDSDLPVLAPAVDLFQKIDIPFTVRILSAHRTPDAARAFAASAKDEEYGVIIAAAGMAAHLAGAIASQTTLPVIGIPVQSGPLSGVDALLSTIQMPPGIPVATVSINGAQNAAILAAQILAVSDLELSKKLEDMRAEMKARAAQKDADMQARYHNA